MKQRTNGLRLLSTPLGAYLDTALTALGQADYYVDDDEELRERLAGLYLELAGMLEELR